MGQKRNFDSAEYLETREDIAEYLIAAIETGDSSFITHAVAVASLCVLAIETQPALLDRLGSPG